MVPPILKGFIMSLLVDLETLTKGEWLEIEGTNWSIQIDYSRYSRRYTLRASNQRTSKAFQCYALDHNTFLGSPLRTIFLIATKIIDEEILRIGPA